MTGRGTPMFTRTVPKGKEKFIPPALIAGWHRVYYKPSQVERSLRPEHFKVGLRVGVLEQRLDFLGNPPEPIFYTGTVEKIWGSDLDIVTIKYDAHPYAVSISFGIKANAHFVIPLGKETKPKTPVRRRASTR